MDYCASVFVTLSELFYLYLALYEYGYNLMTSLYDFFFFINNENFTGNFQTKFLEWS